MRVATYVSRLCDELNARKKDDNSPKPTSLFVMDTGKQTTFSGSGVLLEKFTQGAPLKAYTGFGTEPAKFYDLNFDKAPFRYMKFDQAFHKVVPYDSRSSEHIFEIIFCTRSTFSIIPI